MHLSSDVSVLGEEVGDDFLLEEETCVFFLTKNTSASDSIRRGEETHHNRQWEESRCCCRRFQVMNRIHPATQNRRTYCQYVHSKKMQFTAMRVIIKKCGWRRRNETYEGKIFHKCHYFPFLNKLFNSMIQGTLVQIGRSDTRLSNQQNNDEICINIFYLDRVQNEHCEYLYNCNSVLHWLWMS